MMLEDVRQWLLSADFNAWYYLHATWRTPFLDAVMPFIRNQFFWAPLYLFLLFFLPVNFRRSGVVWCLAFILCFAVSDFTSGVLLKPLFHRIRPCNDPRLSALLHLIVQRSSGWSFPSSHAANHFCLGTFAAVTMHGKVRGAAVLFLLWALLISYAQVYVGVHFPADVIGGGLLGAAIGYVIGTAFNGRFPLIHHSRHTMVDEPVAA